MLRSIFALTVATALLTPVHVVRADADSQETTSPSDWGVLPRLAGNKFVWNAGRARGSHEKELTFHEFRWNGQTLVQTQCSYWPQKSMRPACGIGVVERLADGSLVLNSNGTNFKGEVAADGSVQFVNKTWFGTFTTAFVARTDGSVALTHGNWIDGASLAPLIPIDAARETQIMAELEAVFQSIQAERKEEADRQYSALMGALGAFNTTLSAAQTLQAQQARLPQQQATAGRSQLEQLEAGRSAQSVAAVTRGVQHAKQVAPASPPVRAVESTSTAAVSSAHVAKAPSSSNCAVREHTRSLRGGGKSEQDAKAALAEFAGRGACSGGAVRDVKCSSTRDVSFDGKGKTRDVGTRTWDCFAVQSCGQQQYCPSGPAGGSSQ